MITCAHCGHQFKVFFMVSKGETEKSVEKQMLTAAKANQQGPFCKLCWHLKSAELYASARNKQSVITLIDSALTCLKPGD